MALSPDPSPSSIFSLSFSQDHSSFACGTSSGFCVFNSDPLTELVRREIDASTATGLVAAAATGAAVAKVPLLGQLSGKAVDCWSNKEIGSSQNSAQLTSDEERSWNGGRIEGEQSRVGRAGNESGQKSRESGGEIEAGKRAFAERGKNGNERRGERSHQNCHATSTKNKKLIDRNFQSSNADGFSIAEMRFNPNYVALVLPRYSSNRVVLWDNNSGFCVRELMFGSAVKAVRMRCDRILVALENSIYLYNFTDFRLVHQVQTFTNPRGLCAISSAVNSCVMVCPGFNQGEIRVELYKKKNTRFLQAHDSSLGCISLCHDGSLMATASTKGTLIRIFNTEDGSRLQELRRGADPAEIYSMAFSSNSHWLALSSNKGTVHVFCLREPWLCIERRNIDGSRVPSSSGYVSFPASFSPNIAPSWFSSISNGLELARSSLTSMRHTNTVSLLAFMKVVLPSYFSSEWSLARFRLPEDTKSIVAFGAQRNSVIVICSNGSYFKCFFDVVHGGEMVLEKSSSLWNVPISS